MNGAEQIKLEQAYDACREVARREAKNFYYAFRVLPKHKADAMCAVYAFMRKADDLADDESMSLEERRAAMAAWTEAWRNSRNRMSNDPIFFALDHTQRTFGIPDSLLEQLVAGTTLDLDEVPRGASVLPLATPWHGNDSLQVYDNYDTLREYCYLVASVVGLVCIRIFGYSNPQAEEYAVDTGIAFQLTNILRDVREDALRGRVYLPADRLARYSVSTERLLATLDGEAPQRNELEMLMSLQAKAQNLYRRSEKLIPLLDKDARPAMRVLVRIYRRLLNRIANKPEAVFRERVSVPTVQKLAILSGGLLDAAMSRLPG